MSTLPTIRLVMADDHEIFRDGFRLMLSKNPGFDLIAEAANGKELVDLVEKHRPDIVITDIKMPVMDGIEATRIISDKYPETGVIGLSMYDEEDLVLELLDAGASGYLIKNADKEEVNEAIKKVYCNGQYMCQHTLSQMAHLLAARKNRPKPKLGPADFSERELDIIQLICEEHSNREIADQLFLSVRTVEGYRLRILERMQVKNSIGLAVYAIQNGLFEPKKY